MEHLTRRVGSNAAARNAAARNAAPGRHLRWGRVLRPYRWRLGAAFGALVVASAADLLEPWPLKVIFDHVIGDKPLPAWLARWSAISGGRLTLLNAAAIAAVGIAAVGAMAAYAEKYLSTTVGQRVLHDIRHQLYAHLQHLSLGFHARRETGDMVVLLTNDVDAAQDFVSTALLGIAFSALTLGGMLAVMLWLNWRFTLISLVIAPVLFVVVYRLTRRSKVMGRAARHQEGVVASVLQEAISSARAVKAHAGEAYEVQRLDRESRESVRLVLAARSTKALLSPAVDVLVAAGTCVVLIVGGRMVLGGTLTTGALLVFVLYLGKMYKPMRNLSKMMDTLSRASVAVERIEELLGTQSDVRDIDGAVPAPPFTGRITFEHVEFGYEPARPVLKDVSLTIEPGQVVALVGRTGSGKSSLVGLIPRLYDVWSGRVMVDGRDVREFTLASLRAQVAFVEQNPVLFHAPVWQNIAYARAHCTRAEIVDAARLANADGFISRLPDGYDTIIGERGETLSAGERQRIAIARAIIRQAPILLMDEPSAALDAESEQLVFTALRRLMQGRTTIIIAHRLATVKGADAILVVDDGRIVERGTHHQLLAKGALYARLHDIQFAEARPGMPNVRPTKTSWHHDT